MFGALKRGVRSMAGLIHVRNVVSELRPKRTLAASRGFLAAARFSCLIIKPPLYGNNHLTLRQMVIATTCSLISAVYR